MKKAHSMKSVRSMKSSRSMKSVKSGLESLTAEKSMEIDEYIKNGCQKFYCPYQIIVVRETQRDYRTPKKPEPPVKYKKISIAPSNHQTSDSDTPVAGTAIDTNKETHSDTVVVTALHDMFNNLVELSLSKVQEVPRVLMQVIGLLVPYFSHLTKITLKATCIDKYTVYELNKMLTLSTISEICLDDSPLPEANYAILLDGNSSLRSLSLSRCLVNDDVCKQIADKLHYSEPGEATLCVLNLSSNHITDEGAKYIGKALRTNRHLRYLNLADNRITDDGAWHIFNVLIEFPLTYEEVLEKRRRYCNYLRTKQAMYAKCMNEFDSKSVDEYNQSKRSTTSKKKGKPIIPLKNKASVKKESSFTDDFCNIKAEMMTGELMGLCQDPFGPGNVNLKNGYSHCIGNLILCYLNLSYNHLSYLSVKKLLDIVKYQQLTKAKTGQGGLTKVMLDGNNMPVACHEMTALNDILQKNINCFGSRAYTASLRRKSARISAFPPTDRSVVQL